MVGLKYSEFASSSHTFPMACLLDNSSKNFWTALHVKTFNLLEVPSPAADWTCCMPPLKLLLDHVPAIDRHTGSPTKTTPRTNPVAAERGRGCAGVPQRGNAFGIVRCPSTSDRHSLHPAAPSGAIPRVLEEPKTT
mmetsp:Transcript_155913/g.283577  ORF Transcript_155913/g.283577 Transcript_155913/m.283577 type:complete len:136 (+) Transcript_155913:345-752(+)